MELSVKRLTAEQDGEFWRAVAEGERRSLRDDQARAVRSEFGKDGVEAIERLTRAWNRAPLSLQALVADELLAQVDSQFPDLAISELPQPVWDELAHCLFDIRSTLDRIRATLRLSGRSSEHENSVAETAVEMWCRAGRRLAIGRRNAPSPMSIFVRDAFLKYLSHNYADPSKFRADQARSHQALNDAITTLERLVKIGVISRTPRKKKRS